MGDTYPVIPADVATNRRRLLEADTLLGLEDEPVVQPAAGRGRAPAPHRRSLRATSNGTCARATHFVVSSVAECLSKCETKQNSSPGSTIAPTTYQQNGQSLWVPGRGDVGV